MYTVTVPVMMRENYPLEETLLELKRSGCERVLLSTMRYFIDTPAGKRIDPNAMEKEFTETARRYAEEGIEVGIWIGETMGHGGVDGEKYAYTPFYSLGSVSNGGFCCADELFRRDIADWCAMAARAGAKVILLDDDWRMHSHGDDFFAGCLCPEHVRRYCEMVGETLTPDEIKTKVFTGKGNNPYRDAWQKLMGGDMERLAREIREAVDKVDPTCRIGLCLAPSVIDVDGSDPTTICDILAGGTRPYLRLIGAAYWANYGGGLGPIVTLERMEAKWFEDWRKRADAEILIEGDVYPRPRFVTPAAYLEAMDMICRADKQFSGAMKYMIDYSSSPRYEHGYIDKHVKNRDTAKAIEKMFEGKTLTGMKLFEYQHHFANLTLGDDPYAANDIAYNTFRGQAVRYITHTSVPITFEEGVPVVFGENAKYVPLEELKKGAVIDAIAAEILAGRGLDVGVTIVGVSGEKKSLFAGAGGGIERHLRDNEVTTCTGGTFATLEPKAGAEVMGVFADGKPSFVRYENADGARFAVYPIMAKAIDDTTFFRNYNRQKEMYENAEWIGGAPLDAKIVGHPDAYIMTARDENEVAVGVYNLYLDSMDEPVVELPAAPASVEFVKCEGRVEGNKVYLSDIPAYGFAGFTYKI
ncbi:MAG: hypothetical protein IKV39_01235 [Clostridia bacterium]|nr:hypothetical protein [Clostridia bacterium]